MKVLCLAGLDSDDMKFVAVHGTGTSLGDPIEIAALGQAIANR
jgi:acyl transferase domain-containing protein